MRGTAVNKTLDPAPEPEGLAQLQKCESAMVGVPGTAGAPQRNEKNPGPNATEY